MVGFDFNGRVHRCTAPLEKFMNCATPRILANDSTLGEECTKLKIEYFECLHFVTDNQRRIDALKWAEERVKKENNQHHH